MNQVEQSERPSCVDYREGRPEDLHLWMTTQEAAEYLSYDVEHVRRLAARLASSLSLCHNMVFLAPIIPPLAILRIAAPLTVHLTG